LYNILLTFRDQLGTAKGLVNRTGDRCVTYCMANLASDLSAGDTPIAKEIAHFIQIITDVAIFFGISFFIIALSFGYSFIESIILLLVIILVNVPKGVLGTVTVNSNY
jgi:sodium/potassium-transporting ATPase subunit alpha